VTFGDDTIVRRYSDAVQRRGRQITLRHVTSAGALGPNPPAILNPMLAGNAAAGASVISIRAIAAFGRIVAGDQITIGSMAPIAVASDVLSTAAPVDPSAPWLPGFTSITLAGTLPSAASDGTVIAFTWQSDIPVWCVVGNFDSKLQPTQLLAGDESVVIPAYGIAKPSATDQLLIDGETRTIVEVTQVYQRGLIVAWRVQAR
jgi:hypothetical protein